MSAQSRDPAWIRAAAVAFRRDESFARQLDAEDPLAAYRERFHIPRRADGQPVIYFCGNSLGLEPKAARAIIERELDAWERLAVDAHFKAESPWYSYHELFRETGARLVGALPGEVVMMNGLTVNLVRGHYVWSGRIQQVSKVAPIPRERGEYRNEHNIQARNERGRRCRRKAQTNSLKQVPGKQKQAGQEPCSDSAAA